MKGFLTTTLCVMCLALAFSGDAAANAVTYSGSSGSLSASATFDLTGNTLSVTLVNTSLTDVLLPADVLLAVFFDTANTLTPVSASLDGSTVFYGSLTNVGDGWEYKNGINAHGKNSGIGAAGFGVLGQSNFSASHQNLGGLNYGILSPGDNSNTGNNGVKGHGPLIKNEVQFVLTTPNGFSLDQLGDSVVFQYGTSLDEPSFSGTLQTTPTPEPSTLGLAGSGLLTFFMGLRRRMTKA